MRVLTLRISELKRKRRQFLLKLKLMFKPTLKSRSRQRLNLK